MTANSQRPEAALRRQGPTAQLEPGPPGGECLVKVGGQWRLSGAVPSWAVVLGARSPARVRVVSENLGRWDTSLVLFLLHGRAWCAGRKIEFLPETLPDNLLALLRQASDAGAPHPKPRAAAAFSPALVETAARHLASQAMEGVTFVGECALSAVSALQNPRRFRWMGCLVQMQHCWASSLPIVGLISFLVGVILAFQAAVQLRPFGAAVFVADLVGLAVVREMGPMMAAVIVAGGTGAGFAAQLGNMRVQEEIDALETLGISSMEFLALPRLLAVTVMMPVLAVYANVLGILGGMFVSAAMLDIPAAAYWIETQHRVGFSDVASGLVKSVAFGAAVGFAGCLRGMKCGRSAAGVGAATSSAVVTGITLIVVADALFAVVFNVLGM